MTTNVLQRKMLLALISLVFCCSTIAQGNFEISQKKLEDKIKGGWAGQTIGVTFGGPYEFAYLGTFINDYVKLKWDSSLVADRLINNPGLYDDLYMDLTFVDVIEKYGLNAPLDSFANAFANAGYDLWHANQAARYNILNGIKAPNSGFWKNNPHADCIDYQIESDFAGLMSPAMPNTASAISDKIGHIMNYGDGWYGGVFVGAMYSVAFTANDIEWIVSEGLKTIPVKSEFYQCISDVIKWHKQFPLDWKKTWFEIQRKWSDDVGCPEGVFLPFNIDAKVNAAYVVTGLLYGNGDFTKTLDIATRCGQDADCNPSTCGGILGTMLGYTNIPPYWKKALVGAEAIKFKYTQMSLENVYETGLKHALKNIAANGGKITGDVVMIQRQLPRPVRFEKSFSGISPVDREPLRSPAQENEKTFSFNGTGFVITGKAIGERNSTEVINALLTIDGVVQDTIFLPVAFAKRRTEVAWKYDLPLKKHTVVIRALNGNFSNKLELNSYIVYTAVKP